MTRCWRIRCSTKFILIETKHFSKFLQNFHLIFFSKVDENLTDAERKAAWEEFENEKKGFVNMGNPELQNNLMSSINPQAIQDQYRLQYPGMSEEQVVHATRAYIMQLQSGMHRRPAYDKSHYQQVLAHLYQFKICASKWYFLGDGANEGTAGSTLPGCIPTATDGGSSRRQQQRRRRARLNQLRRWWRRMEPSTTGS
jgi:hypothetical protein